MRLTDLIVEDLERKFTGVPAVDELVGSVSRRSTIEAGLPIIASESEWTTLASPMRLYRSFEFESPAKLKYFINEILAYQTTSQHHCTMTVDYSVVQIETYTHDVNNVTEQDLKLARFVDEIYEDTRFLSR
jgi:pterin-4a-carbinolamine dehydratase